MLREENRRALRERGTVVYLLTTVDQQLKRTAKDRNRPLLQVRQPRAGAQRYVCPARPALIAPTSDICRAHRPAQPASGGQ
ncbi:shikimate kinase [Vreelandella titanicae]|uniref:shikimate kinase n=1 Tax=Vreelandella titanicae TaxID=664683 RepID=UPI003D28CF0E